MEYASLIFAALAAALHVFIFTMESLTWTSEKTRATFDLSAEQAESTKEMAFNQGFYNLFLAIAIFVGIVFVLIDRETIGYTLIVVGALSMVAAAAVLFLSSPGKRDAAMKQGIIPLISLVCLLIALN